jgi:hypothetical protein
MSKCPDPEPPHAGRGLRSRQESQELVGHTQPIGEGNRYMRIMEIQDQVGRGEYRVDTNAVAEAILRRLLHKEAEGSGKRPQAECS